MENKKYEERRNWKDLDGTEIRRKDFCKGILESILDDIEFSISFHKVVNSETNKYVEFSEVPKLHSKEVGLLALNRYNPEIDLDGTSKYLKK